MTKKLLIYLVLLTSGISVSAQQNYSAQQAYGRAQKEREEGHALWGKDNATPQEMEQGITKLKNVLVFLDSIPKELSQGNTSLLFRSSDVYRDLASAYAISNQKEQALATLEKVIAAGSGSYAAQWIEDDSAFNSLRTEPRYIAVINKLKNKGLLWKNSALKTAYSPNLSEAEKVAGLSLLWSQAKYNFANFDLVNIDWNKTYLDYLPKVIATKSTSDYYKVLMNFYAQLKDGHTNVYPPKELVDEFYSRPPFRTELIEGRVFVSQIFSDSLLKTGIKPGLEILKIDGQPIIDFAEKDVKPYQSSSTPQDLEIRAFSYALLSGAKEKPLVLELKEPNGKINTRTIARTGYHDVRTIKSIQFKTIGNIGYLTLNSFSDNTVPKQFDSLYTEIAKTKGLIIDIRYNGGGSDANGFYVLGCLTDKSFQSSAARVPMFGVNPEPYWYNPGIDEMKPNGKKYYDKPVVVLIGPRSFSAAEDFAVAFDCMKRGKLIGLPTGGSTGQPVSFDLPGGGSARVCGKRETYPDGKEFIGIGIIPNITVKTTIKDLLSGTDAAKNKALEVLNK
jgi:C-terminal processing protease CtpA/Prc